MSVVMRKWYVPGACRKPLPGTKAMPVFLSTSRQQWRSTACPSASAAAMAFGENLMEGKAYIAPSTSWQWMLRMEFRASVTSFALYLSDSQIALYSTSNLALVEGETPSVGGLTMSSTVIWPMEFEHRLMDLSFTSCSITTGLKLCKQRQPPRRPHSPSSPFETECREASSQLLLSSSPSVSSTFLKDTKAVPSLYTFSRQTSSAMTTMRFLTENLMIFAIVSALRMEPVGLPGLITTIAFTLLPCCSDSWQALSSYSMSSCHPLLSLRKQDAVAPPLSEMEAVQSGYCGMGIIIASFLSTIKVLRSR